MLSKLIAIERKPGISNIRKILSLDHRFDFSITQSILSALGFVSITRLFHLRLPLDL